MRHFFSRSSVDIYCTLRYDTGSWTAHPVSWGTVQFSAFHVVRTVFHFLLSYVLVSDQSRHTFWCRSVTVLVSYEF
jgi:hypothetical protein